MPDTAKRPNILFLMADEHRADFTGWEGHPVVRTPALDALAKDAVVFRNAYTPSPICVPARPCLMAGKLPRHLGCERYGQDLPPFSTTFARRLAETGYTTVCAGKLHHTGPDQMQGWTHRLAGDIATRYPLLPDFAATAPRDSLADVKWSDAKEIARAGIGSGPHLRDDEHAVATTLDFLDAHFLNQFYDRPSHQPLLLKVSLHQPHYPYFCDEARFTYYLDRVRPFLDQPAFDHPFLSTRQVRPGIDVSERELRRCVAAYHGMIESADALFAQVLNRLRHLGQDLDDWVIVYCSDHGEMLGEHGVWEKQKFFEASVRVPLFIRWPRRFAPRVVTQNVNLCDLFATLCELAHAPVPADLDSRSLAPLCRGDAADWDDETISQFNGTNLLIKRGSLKYQWYARPDCVGHEEVLFDLERDPTERVNFAADPAYTDRLPAFRARRDQLGFAPAT